ncbi:MAG: hypothetical protein KAU17_05650 [Spirochaetales bacterium]|nr:hypothetical protein [Spirochaetales bacterium]
MLNQKKLLILQLLLLILFSCVSTSKATIEFGNFESGVYRNNFFNLTVKIPDSWYVVDDKSRIELMKEGIKLIAGDNDSLKAVFNAADLENLNLLTASEYPTGAPVSFNPSFIIMAEKVEHLPGIVKGKDYHFHTKKLIESSAVSVSYSNEIYEVQLCRGHTFDVMELEINIGKIKILQKQYAAIINGYALLFGLTYSNEMELGKLNNIIQTIELD